MNPIFASDLALILRDGAGMASPMTSGAVTATGILGVASETFTTESNLSVVQGETWTAIYAPSDFSLAPIVNGGVVSFGTDRFMVRHIDRVGDGLESKAYMEKLPVSATPDSLSDALVAALTVVAPAGCTVTDHKPLPISPEQIPAAGYLCVWLFDDQPKEDGYTDSTEKSERRATFKVCIRTSGDPSDSGWNILHATRALRKVIAKAVKADPTFGQLAFDSRLGGWRPQAVETTLSIGAAEVDVLVDYDFDPETA